jgi:hypothetical protein
MAAIQPPQKKQKPVSQLGGHSLQLPRPKPLSLDDLMEHAEGIAEQQLRAAGQIVSTVFLVGKTGFLVFQQDAADTSQSKDDFYLATRLLCVAHSASVMVMVMGGWAKVPTTAGQRPPKTKQRIEILMLVGEARGISRRKYLPVHRTKTGRFRGFGAGLMLPGGELEGRFAQLLAPAQPTGLQRHWASTSLRRLGLMPGQTEPS